MTQKRKNEGMLGHTSDMHTTEKLKVLMKLSEKASICNNRVFFINSTIFQIKYSIYQAM